MGQSSISVVLPVHNQADHIEQVTTGYVNALEPFGIDFELLLVVNNSRDGSARACRKIESQCDRIRVLEPETGGWGPAVKAGLQQAAGELLCYANCARTNPTDLALLLLRATGNPGSVVKATRKTRKGALRRFGSLLYNLQCRWLFDLPWRDINGTPKVFSRSHGELLKLTRDDDLIDLEFSLMCRRMGYPLIEVPIRSSARHGGKSTTTIRSALRMFWKAGLMWRASRKEKR